MWFFRRATFYDFIHTKLSFKIRNPNSLFLVIFPLILFQGYLVDLHCDYKKMVLSNLSPKPNMPLLLFLFSIPDTIPEAVFSCVVWITALSTYFPSKKSILTTSKWRMNARLVTTKPGSLFFQIWPVTNWTRSLAFYATPLWPFLTGILSSMEPFSSHQGSTTGLVFK